MSWTLGTAGGGIFQASEISEQVYSPVFDTPMSIDFFKLLPSFYSSFMEDKDIMEVLWSAALQQGAGDLLRLWTIDYAKSLRDVPILSQRKWYRLDLFQAPDFTVDPGLSFNNLGRNLFIYKNKTIEANWSNRGRSDRAFLPLRGQVSEKTSLQFTVNVTLTQVEAKAGALFGFFSSKDKTSSGLAKDQLADMFGAFCIGTSASAFQVGVIHFDPQGAPTVSVSSFSLALNTLYKLQWTYAVITGVAVVQIFEVEFERLSGTSGYTEGEGELYTKQFLDDSADFSSVLPGDYLVISGTRYRIATVISNTELLIEHIQLPAQNSGIIYTIIGPEEVTSVSLDLPGDAPNPTFIADSFGTMNLDMRSVTSSVMAGPGLAHRRNLRGTTTNWIYTDPSFSERVISLPLLQNVIVNPTIILTENLDYSIVDNAIAFQEVPQINLWAEYIAWDEYFIQNNFGKLVNLEGDSSDQYLARVRGLFCAYWKGPTLQAIHQGVHILVGLPIAEKAGTVTKVDLTYSGDFGIIAIDSKEYLFPLSVGTTVAVDDKIQAFAPLCEGVEVIDYLTVPTWFINRSDFSELEKYHSFAIKLSVDVFTSETLVLAGQFVDTIKPTWKQVFFIGYKNIEDLFEVEDDLGLTVKLHLIDPLCGNHPEVNYDDAEWEGTEEDWDYDQGLADWDETTPAIRQNTEALTGLLTLSNGSALAVGSGTAFTTEIGGPGAVTDKYVAVAEVFSGVGGIISSANTNTFSTFVTHEFNNLEVGNAISISGEGLREIIGFVDTVLFGGTGTLTGITSLSDPEATFQVLGVQPGDKVSILSGSNIGTYTITSVPSETSLVFSPAVGTLEAVSFEILRRTGLIVDSPLVTPNAPVAWDAVGQLKIWGQVASTASATSLTFSSLFTGTSGTYMAALIDPEFLPVFYDQFEELCPDEELTFKITAVAGIYPQVVNLPISQTTTAPYALNALGDTATSTISELVP